MTQTLIGRGPEFAEATRVMTSVGRRGLVVRGEAGVGKTVLARQLIEDAHRQARWIATSGGMRGLAFSALAGLLPASFSPSGATIGLDTLIAIRDLLRTLGDESGPLVLGVDDLQNVDDASASVLAQAVRAEELFLVGTLRDGQECAEPLADLWTSEDFEILRLGGLSRSETLNLATELIGYEIGPSAADSLYRRTLGNPLYTRELVQIALRESEHSSGVAIERLLSSLPPGERLVDLVLNRIRGLPETSQEVLELISLSEPLELDILEAAAPPTVDVSMTIRLLERQKLVRSTIDEGGIARYALDHPIQSEVLRQNCPAPARRSVQRRLADALEARGLEAPFDLTRYALFRQESGQPAPPEIVVKAVRLASASYNPALGEKLAAGGGASAAVLLGLADAQHRLGKYTEAERTLARIELSPSDPPGLVVEKAALSIYNRFWGLDDFEGAMAEATQNANAFEGEARVAVDSLRFLMLCFSRRHFDVLNQLDPFDFEDERNRPLVPPYLFSLAASGHALSALNVIRPLLEAADGSEHPVSVPWQLGLAAQISHRLGWDTAPDLKALTLDQITRIHDAGVRYSDRSAIASSTSMLGAQAYERGQVATSSTLFQQAIEALTEQDWIGLLPWTYGGAAFGLLATGDIDRARALLEALPPVRANQRWYSYLEQIGRAWISLNDGLLQAAENQLVSLGEELAAAGERYFALVAWHQLIRLCLPYPIAGRLSSLAELVEGRYAVLLSRHAVAWETADGAALEDVARDFAEQDYPLYAAEAYAQAAFHHRQKGLLAREAAASRLSHEFADRCEGAKTPALALASASALEGLTKAERQVATLAARGLTSPEIAKELVISVRTVDSHLGRIYNKLGVAGRGELQTVLGSGS